MSAGVCFFAHIQCIDFTVSMNMLTKLVTYYYDSGSSDYSSKIVFDVLALPAARGVKSLPIMRQCPPVFVFDLLCGPPP